MSRAHRTPSLHLDSIKYAEQGVGFVECTTGTALETSGGACVQRWAWKRSPCTTCHYFASGLIAEGCDVVTVQHALGHSSASITLNVYSHLWPKAEDRTRAAAANLMATTTDPADSVRTLAGF